MHHIVMEGAFSNWSKANRKYVTEARSILRKHGISPQGDHNVVWAPNKGHSVEYAKGVRDALKAASGSGKPTAKTTQAVKDALEGIRQDLVR